LNLIFWFETGILWQEILIYIFVFIQIKAIFT